MSSSCSVYFSANISSLVETEHDDIISCFGSYYFMKRGIITIHHEYASIDAVDIEIEKSPFPRINENKTFTHVSIICVSMFREERRVHKVEMSGICKDQLAKSDPKNSKYFC